MEEEEKTKLVCQQNCDQRGEGNDNFVDNFFSPPGVCSIWENADVDAELQYLI
jgi:hypothetical protein